MHPLVMSHKNCRCRKYQQNEIFISFIAQAPNDLSGLTNHKLMNDYVSLIEEFGGSCECFLFFYKYWIKIGTNEILGFYFQIKLISHNTWINDGWKWWYKRYLNYLILNIHRLFCREFYFWFRTSCMCTFLFDSHMTFINIKNIIKQLINKSSIIGTKFDTL